MHTFVVHLSLSISQVGTMHTVLARLAGMLKRSLEGTSKYLLEKLNVCGRDLLRWIHALQRAGGRMQ